MPKYNRVLPLSGVVFIWVLLLRVLLRVLNQTFTCAFGLCQTLLCVASQLCPIFPVIFASS